MPRYRPEFTVPWHSRNGPDVLPTRVPPPGHKKTTMSFPSSSNKIRIFAAMRSHIYARTTMILKLYSKNNNPDDIQRVVDILNEGGIIIYPTDTMYAIGCHALKERPIERVCKLKNIDPRKPNLSIICYDLSNISEYANVNNTTFKLMKRNLPGPFTFILNADSRLPKIFRNRKEVGIRVPDNPIIREICHALDAPILTTTLPLEEGEDIEYATDPELINEKFGEKVNLIIDGGIGGIEPSTVINCCKDTPEIIRQGKGELKE